MADMAAMAWAMAGEEDLIDAEEDEGEPDRWTLPPLPLKRAPDAPVCCCCKATLKLGLGMCCSG